MTRGILTAISMVAFMVAVQAPSRAASKDEPVKITVIQDDAVSQRDDTQETRPAIGCDLASPVDAAQGEAIARKIAGEERFDRDLILAIARQESGFRMNSVSSAGAIGLMQLMPGTAKRFDVDICDPEDNVRGAIRYLRLLQKRYQNPIYVLAAYNAGEGAVEQNRGVPLYAETVRYVSAILTDLYGWKPLEAAKSRAVTAKSGQEKPDGHRPEPWSQGFVLHVE